MTITVVTFVACIALGVVAGPRLYRWHERTSALCRDIDVAFPVRAKRRPPTILELRARASRELWTNMSITVYDFVDGAEVNRRPASPLSGLAAAFVEMRETVQDQLFASISSAAESFKGFNEALKGLKIDD